jgi:hypothetical protein
MVMVKSTKDSEAGIPPSPQLMAGMEKLAESMTRDGVLLASDGDAGVAEIDMEIRPLFDPDCSARNS